MLSAPGAGKVDNFVISVGGTTIGTCVVSGIASFGSTTLLPVSIGTGTAVRIDTDSTGSARPGSLTIAP